MADDGGGEKDNPLEFFTDDELFEEIARRSQAVVLIWSKNTLKSEDLIRHRYSGPLAENIGLLAIAKHKYLSEFSSGE